jgi:hypothetical protein
MMSTATRRKTLEKKLRPVLAQYTPALGLTHMCVEGTPAKTMAAWLSSMGKHANVRGSMRRFFVASMLVWLLAVVTCGQQAAAPVREGVFVDVVRFNGPDNTMLTLFADGVLERAQGGHLIVRQQGRLSLEPARARALIDQARALKPAPSTESGDGDVYVVAASGRPVVVAGETNASQEVRRFIDAMLRQGEQVTLQPNTFFYLRAEPVDEARARRLADAGARPLALDSMDAAHAQARSEVETALRSTHRLHRIPVDLYRALQQTFNAREAYIRRDSSWYQLQLWSPPDGPTP